jgi:hypothetical protein
MIAVGVLLAWTAYGLGVWGVSLLKGWNLGFKDIWSPVAYYNGSWPPQTAGNTVIIPDGSADALTTASFQTASTTASTGTSTGSVGPAPSGLSGTATIQKAAAAAGWGSGSQYTCLLNVINAESGGNANAANASGAYGAAQALGHGTPATTGCGRSAYGPYGGNSFGLSDAQMQQANCGNLWYQLVWMMGYIKVRWGTPCGAWANEQANHWY